jgi:hypothetical protein
VWYRKNAVALEAKDAEDDVEAQRGTFDQGMHWSFQNPENSTFFDIDYFKSIMCKLRC